MLSAYDKLSTVVNSAVDKSQRKLKGLSTSLKNFGNNSIVGGGVATAFFASTISAAEESEVAGNRLKQVFKSMGESNDAAAIKSMEYASQLQLQIGVEDELINATQAKIATFKSVSNETARMAGIFDRATAAAFDMQATGFGEASGNAVQLGKALEDPVKGIVALRKSGITFTEAERKKIQVLVSGNKKLEAQKMILAAVEKQVGGVAKATATTTGKTKVGWGEVMETIGKQLLPVVNRFANILLSKVIPAVSGFIEKNPLLVKVLGAVSVALFAVGTAARIVSAIMMTNPIVLIIAAIAAAAFLIYKNWGAIKAWFQRLWDNVKAIFNAAWQWIKRLFLNYTPVGLVIKHWSKITAFFSNLWQGVKNVFSSVWDWIKGLFLKYTPMGIIYRHWDEIVAYFTNIWEKVKNVFKNAWANIKSGLKSFFTGGRSDAEAALEKYKATLTKTVNIGIANQPGAVNNTTAFGAPALQPAPVNNKSISTFAPVINYSGPGGPAAATQIGNDIAKQMKAYEDQKKRTQF